MTIAVVIIKMNLNFVNLTLVSISALIVIWLIILQLKFWRLKKRLHLFFSGSQAEDLEGVLAEQIKRWRFCQTNLENLEKLSQQIKKVSQASLHKVGLVRFNPFANVGSDQSFSIAFLDHEHNGLIISSLYTQEGCRVYAKPITKGTSIYPLSKEEKQAMTKAIG